jgi:hypothetical protein
MCTKFYVEYYDLLPKRLWTICDLPGMMRSPGEQHKFHIKAEEENDIEYGGHDVEEVYVRLR